MQWKLDELLDTANAVEVANHIGMKTKKRGKILYCQCPTGHKETALNHCQLFNDGCHCYSCGAHLSTYEMVKTFFSEVNGVNLSYDEICEYIADTCGGADIYLEKKDAKSKKFPLTKKELEVLRINSVGRQIKTIVAFSDEKTEECDEFDLKAGGYVKYKMHPGISIYSLFKEDEKTTLEIIKNKYNEALIRVNDFINACKSENNENESVKLWLKQSQKEWKTLMRIRNKIKEYEKSLA